MGILASWNPFPGTAPGIPPPGIPAGKPLSGKKNSCLTLRATLEAGAVPAKQKTDARHIASATVHGLDFDKAIRLTAMVNEAEDYDGIGIYEPGEVIGDGRA